MWEQDVPDSESLKVEHRVLQASFHKKAFMLEDVKIAKKEAAC